MEVITIESKVYKDIIEKIENYKNISEKIDNIDRYVKSVIQPNINDIWVDNYEVCTILKISEKTLQRLRNKGLINYSIISKRAYYTVGEIKRILDNKLIKSIDSNKAVKDMLEYHKSYYAQKQIARLT